jgi:hypothetical protein
MPAGFSWESAAHEINIYKKHRPKIVFLLAILSSSDQDSIVNPHPLFAVPQPLDLFMERFRREIRNDIRELFGELTGKTAPENPRD